MLVGWLVCVWVGVCRVCVGCVCVRVRCVGVLEGVCVCGRCEGAGV